MESTTPEIDIPGNGRSLFAQGEFDWGIVSSTGLVLKEDVSEEQWLKLTESALAAYEYHGTGFARAALYVADLLNWGDEHLGERHSQAIDGTRAFLSRKEKTIANWRWIASKIPPSRRRENIDSLAIYEAVAKLDAKEQDELLALADEDALSVKELKAKVRDLHPLKARQSKNGSKPDKTPANINNLTEAKNVAVLLSNYLTANEDKIKPGSPLFEVMGHINKLWRRIGDKGRKR